jgi:carbohydrate-selective porin OprB
MSTWNVTSKSVQTGATYTEGIYKVEVSYNEDATTDTLMSINGNIYKGEQQTYAGNFNGNRNGEEMSYSFSGVKLSDMNAVTTMVIDIENIITNGEGE